MRIALVNPTARNCEGYHTIGTRIPQLGLQVLARLVPQRHDVEIIDEIFGSDDTERLLTTRGYDLVGITAYTSGATRAYELARFCREHEMPTIMGGPHAWAQPDEAAAHFDSVAIGECDDVWPQIIADADAGRLQPRYEGRLADLEAGHGTARQGMHPINGSYDVGSIQTSRGCPVGCDFCSVTLFNGKDVRRRRPEDVVAEWNQTDRKFLFVVDDNFYGVGPRHGDEAKEILRAIIKHGKKRLWFSQTSVNMGADPEALRLAYKAGCRGMLIGFESFNPTSLQNWHKGLNYKLVEQYKELVDGFHRAGLAVFGCFVVGADEDTEEAAAETVLKAVRLGIDIIQITNLTPLPGTKLYERWLREGRVLATEYPRDWERYTFIETVYRPQRMTAERLDETIYELRKAAAEESWVWKRTVKTLWRTRSLSTALFVHGMNLGWVRLARGLKDRDRQRFAHVRTDKRRAQKIRQAFAFRCGKELLPA